ncbi:creatinine amidohydrolase [Tropicimonas sediminicola]|uniref:Creatinine amidohydrolase n=2 Tax=Tropicimonas sediminicola TaxID=1031541 RepID=A0A239DHT6_9RHOB|nr:creatinine amidohydrolase [Tropicimonas sediminicola]
MIRDFAALSWPDVAGDLSRNIPAILPVGAIEQHGAHLPLTVDRDLAEGVARAIAERTGAFLLPACGYGETWSSEAFPGTLSISPETLRAMIQDIGRGLIGMGIPALITLNGHFGNSGPIALAARTLLSEGLPVLHLDYPGLEPLAGKICTSKPAGPGFYHADEVETSMMLALRPEAVQMDRATPEYPDFPPTFGQEPFQLREISESGVFGDPRAATAEKGRMLIHGIADAAVPLIDAFLTRHGLTTTQG